MSAKCQFRKLLQYDDRTAWAAGKYPLKKPSKNRHSMSLGLIRKRGDCPRTICAQCGAQGHCVAHGTWRTEGTRHAPLHIDLRATARLPGMDVEVVHRRSPAGARGDILISWQAMPLGGAFDSFMYAANPFVYWVEAIRLTWLEAARALMPPSNAAPTLQKDGSNVVTFSKTGLRRSLRRSSATCERFPL
jgi:hypothetical protein